MIILVLCEAPFPIWIAPVPLATLPIERLLTGRIVSTLKEPRTVVITFAEPRVNEPVVKLDPTVIAEFIFDALITFTNAVDIFNKETFTDEKFCTPDHVLGCVFTYVQKLLVHSVVAALVELSVFAKIVEVMIGCTEKV
jgi:hypothetical protein